MNQAYQIIEEAGYTVEEVRDYLDDMREDGGINMFGAGEFLGRKFGFDRRDQKEIVLQYVTVDGLREVES